MPDFRRSTAVAAFAALILANPVLASDDDGEDSAGPYLQQAEIDLQANEYLKAVREYVKAAEISDDPDVARLATRTAFGFGFSKEGLTAAKRWSELDESSDEALVYTAQLELRLGDLRAARRDFTTLLEKGRQPPDEALLSLLPVFSDEDPENVDKLMRMLAKPYPDSAAAHYAVGATSLQAGDYDTAKKESLRASELEADWVKPKLLYGRALLLSGEEDKAIDYTARIIGDDPDPDPDARLELALMYMSAGRDDDALSQVNQVLLEQSGRPDALRLMAIINFRSNNLDAAEEDFQDLLSSGHFTMDAVYYLARIADVRGEIEKAIQLYSEVDDGQNAVTAQRRASAMLAFDSEKPDLALERLDKFANEHPQYAIDMVVARAQLLTSLERYDQALTEYDRAIGYRPDDEAVSLGRAELLLRMGRQDDAIDSYRQAAKRWPHSAMSLNALGYTLADRTDDYRQAEKLIRKALEIEPDSPAIIDSYGWVLYKRGHPNQALEQLKIAYDKFPDPEVAAHLVEVLASMDRKDEALQLLSTAEEKNPDSEFLKDVRERFFPGAP